MGESRKLQSPIRCTHTWAKSKLWAKCVGLGRHQSSHIAPAMPWSLPRSAACVRHQVNQGTAGGAKKSIPVTLLQGATSQPG